MEGCENCPQFREVQGKLVILLWIMGLGVPMFVGGILWANVQLAIIREGLSAVSELHRRMTITETKVDDVRLDVAELKSKLDSGGRK